jgi:arginine decarboxylase
MISAAVALALTEDPDRPGLIMEYSSRGHREAIVEIVQEMVKEGMKLRGWPIKELKSIGIEYKVKKVGAALAAVVLWG